MPFIHGLLSQFQPLITASISLQTELHNRVSVQALIDTGATRTCLTHQLISRLGLPPRGKMLVATAGSYPERRRSYGFSFGIYVTGTDGGLSPLPYVFPDECIAPGFQDNDNMDVLIGMDLLSRGTLTFRPDQSFTFEFIAP